MNESAFNETVRARINQLYTEIWHLQMYLSSSAGTETVAGNAEPVRELPQPEASADEPLKLGKPLPRLKPGRKRKYTLTPEQEQDIVKRYQAGESKTTIGISLGHKSYVAVVEGVLTKHGIRIRSHREQMKMAHAVKGKNWFNKQTDENESNSTQPDGEECLN